MKTLIVWFLVSYGSNSSISFSPTFPTLQACEQFKQAVYEGYMHKGKCVQTTIVDQGK